MLTFLALSLFALLVVSALRDSYNRTGLRPPVSSYVSPDFGGAYFDMPAAAAALKELYDGQMVENEVYSENPAFATIAKDTGFVGKYRPIPLEYGVSQGTSSSFSAAQQYQSPVQLAEFNLTRKRKYSIATIDNETMLASSTDKGAFIDGAKVVVDGAIQSSVLAISADMYRSGTGSRGQISGSVSTGVITLANAAQALLFEPNMVLQANATDGGASPRAALGYVISVDTIAGTITVANSMGGAAASPSGWSANDYLLMNGDNNAVISGWQAWLLSSAPSSTDNFYGVNRSAFRWRLAGGYFDGSSMPIKEALVKASQQTAANGGGSVNIAYVNFTSYAALEIDLQNQVQYTKVNGEGDAAEVAFDGIKIMGAKGPITVVPDRNCPAATAMLLTKSKWKLYSLGEAPQILTYEDSNQMLRVTNADACELRVGMYGNLGTPAPGKSCQVALSI